MRLVFVMNGATSYSVVARAQERSVAGYSNAGDRDVVLRNQLMRAFILAQIPDPNVPTAIAADQLALVRVDNHIIDRHAVGVVSLQAAAARVPDLDRAVLGARDHPFAVAVEGHACDVCRVSVEGEDCVRVRGFDVVEFHGVVPGGGEEALVGGDAKPVDLRVGVRDGA